jgi:hypothetical protein
MVMTDKMAINHVVHRLFEPCRGAFRPPAVKGMVPPGFFSSIQGSAFFIGLGKEGRREVHVAIKVSVHPSALSASS